MGLLVGTIFYPVISETKRHKAIMWGFRIAAVPVVVVLFVVLIRNFYTSDPYSGTRLCVLKFHQLNFALACSWCRYLSCIPTSANNHCKGYGLILYHYTTFPYFQFQYWHNYDNGDNNDFFASYVVTLK